MRMNMRMTRIMRILDRDKLRFIEINGDKVEISRDC
jgi:hypothetical protein